MKTSKAKVSQIVLTAFALSTALITGCGSKSNNNQQLPYVPPTAVTCVPGQICPTGIVGGTTLIPAPTVSSLDYQGSALILNYAATGATTPIAGTTTSQAYNGTVTITGTLHLVAGACLNLPPGDYPVQGQGQWISNYGGAVAGIQATLQAQNSSVQIGTSLISAGQDPYGTTVQGVAPSGYYLQGQVAVSMCGRVFTAL